MVMLSFSLHPLTLKHPKPDDSTPGSGDPRHSDHDGIAVICKEREVDMLLHKMNPKPVLAITDSQVFPKADAAVPKEIPLTSFSIVLARQKGDLRII